MTDRRSDTNEQVLMLAELNHRFFNSFQVISALAARCGRAKNPEDLRPMLAELDERLIAFATLHRKLAEPLGNGLLEDYCRSLCDALIRAFGRRDVALLAIENIELSSEQAMRIPFIVVELVTNALKHSLRDEPDGTIWIEVRATRSAIEIVAYDSARKACARPLPAPSRFVEALAASLSGEAFVIDRPGYAAHVRIPRAEETEKVTGFPYRPNRMLSRVGA